MDEQLGIMTFREALAKAEEMGLDLVEIAPTAKPPVAKIIDYGKLRYDQAKKEKESKKAQVMIKVKEIKLKPNIDTHDFQTKVKHARDFLLKGNKVRISIMFRGREMLHIDLGEKVVKQFCEELSDIAIVEAPSQITRPNYDDRFCPRAASGLKQHCPKRAIRKLEKQPCLK